MAIEKLNIFPPTLVHSYFTIQLIHDKLQIMIQYDTYSQIEYAVHTETCVDIFMHHSHHKCGTLFPQGVVCHSLAPFPSILHVSTNV
jgi:hypothetical protein